MELMESSGSLQAWVPRGLLHRPKGDDPVVMADGLVAVELSWQMGHLQQPRLLSPSDARPEQMALPRLVDPHVHLDKAFTWDRAPNFAGTYDAALTANFQEHQSRTLETVRERGERGLRLACANGLRALRSHIDSVGPGHRRVGPHSWTCAGPGAIGSACNWWLWRLWIIGPLRRANSWQPMSPLRRVCSGAFSCPRSRHQGCVVSCVRCLISPSDSVIDLHIDEADHDPAAGLIQLLAVLDQRATSVPITCSHCSSLGLASERLQRRICEQLARHRVDVVALPLTNGWLLGRQGETTPIVKPPHRSAPCSAPA